MWRNRSRAALALAAGSLAAAALAAPPADAAAPARPRWSIGIAHRNPYGLQEGACGLQALVEARCGVDPFSGSGESFDRDSGFNTYEISVADSGEAAVAASLPPGEPVVVEDVLPEGLELAGLAGAVAGGEGWSCTVSAVEGRGGESQPRRLTCTRQPPTELEPGRSYPPIALRVHVGPGAPDLARDVARVSGGGAWPQEATANPREGETAIAPAVPFGIERFSMRDLAEEEEPRVQEVTVCREAGRPLSECPRPAEQETVTVEVPGRPAAPERQAGGHPLALSTELVFDFTTNDEGALTGAGGGQTEFGVGPKDVAVELPPGFTGDPRNAPQCPLEKLLSGPSGCPLGAAVGFVRFGDTKGAIVNGRPEGLTGTRYVPIYNALAPPGHPAAFAFFPSGANKPVVVLEARVRDGDYGVSVGTEASASLRGAAVTFCSYGVAGTSAKPRCGSGSPQSAPFLSNPTQCTEAPIVALRSDPYPSGEAGEEAGHAYMRTYMNGASGPPALLGERVLEEFQVRPGQSVGPAPEHPLLEGCEKLTLEPTIEGTRRAPELQFKPSPPAEGGTGRADSPSAMTFDLSVPQTNEASAPATPAVKDLRMSLPEGLSLSPAAADGLEACSNAQFGLGSEFGTPSHPLPAGMPPTEPANEARCPLSSQIGTVEAFTPLLAEEANGQAPLRGELFVAQPECEPCSSGQQQEGKLFRLFLQLEDRKAGLLIKLTGQSVVNPQSGRLETSFEDQPQQPYERVLLRLKGGPRAPLSTPQSCGPATSEADLTPWSAPETPDAHPAFSFTVEGCQSIFSPGFTAGTEYPQAGAYSHLQTTVSREDGEGDLNGIAVHMPPGLTAKLAGIPLCEEAKANSGSCPAESQIGTTTALLGSGSHPFAQEGRVYLTGPYKSPATGAEGPFGLSIVVPTKAGPFTLEGNTGRGEEVVRAAIEINPQTAAVTVLSDPLPQSLDGVALRLRKVNVDINREGFERNPTNCTRQEIESTITSTQAQSASPGVPFDVGGCAALPFAPSFSATTEGRSSRSEGASLTVKVSQKEGEANIRKVGLQLPEALPSRESTLKHACTEAQFASDPNRCPPESIVGHATARTPLLSVPLSGPAILVSHGGAEFPDLDFRLEGEGVKIDLVGHTQIRKGITYSRFEALPDNPISSFETVLPEGPHSILAANGNLCAQTLSMPTTITAQNGRQTTKDTRIAATGCRARLTNAQKLKRALSACRKAHRNKRPRTRCEAKARRRYGKKARKASLATGALTPAALTAALQAAARRGSTALEGAAGALTGASPAGAADPPGSCENEALRAESNTNPSTGEPYSMGLPECRAYELVSPAEKQGRDVLAPPIVVAPSGEAAGFVSEGGFAGPNNFYLSITTIRNVYVSARSSPAGVPGWRTSSAFAPAGLVQLPNLTSLLDSDFSPDLSSAQAGCGLAPSGGYACAMHEANGSWRSTPAYMALDGSVNPFLTEADVGQSADLSRVFLEPHTPLLAQDHITGAGIYEISGLGAGAPRLRLVNVSGGEELHLLRKTTGQNGEGVETETPLLGDLGTGKDGTSYHAVSETGTSVFFTATAVVGGEETYPALYARVPCSAPGPACSYLEGAGAAVEGRETVLVSCPAGEGTCTRPRSPATFQGASADGSKLFFTTAQPLLAEDRDATSDLYEYDFGKAAGRRLTLLSLGGGEPGTTNGDGAIVQGVVRSSADGSHVYFVATGRLTDAPNALGRTAEAGEENLYVADTTATPAKVSFIGALPQQDRTLWGQGGCHGESEPEGAACDFEERQAQATPDGHDLVFATHARLSGEDHNGCEGRLDGKVEVCSAAAVYRYDAARGQLTWISRPAAGVSAPNEGKSAQVEALQASLRGAMANFEDAGRALSGCAPGTSAAASPGCPEGSHDGEYVIFTTSERLQGDALGGGPEAYLWHCAAPCEDPSQEGEVSLLSSGHDREGAGSAVVSATGRDIFFTTTGALVAQDGDELRDLYDARLDGGIAAPLKSACAGESCQGAPSTLPSFRTPASALFTGAGNVTAGALTRARATAAGRRAGSAASAWRRATAAPRRAPRRAPRNLTSHQPSGSLARWRKSRKTGDKQGRMP